MTTCSFLQEDIATLRRLWSHPNISIRKTRGSGSPQLSLRYRIPGNKRTQRVVTVPSWAAAQEAASRINNELSAGTVPRRRGELFAPTFDEAAETFRRGRELDNVAESTVESEQYAIRVLRDVVARDTGDDSPRVSQLRADHGVQFIAYLREQRGNAGSTVQQRWSLARQFWQWASSHYFGTHSIAPVPLTRARRGGVKAHPIATFGELGIVAPFLLGDARLHGFGKDHPTTRLWAKAFTLQWATGLRLSQACELQWSDINFDDGQIHIHRGTKTHQEAALDRRIFAPDWLLEEVSSWKRVSHWPVSVLKDGQAITAPGRTKQRMIGLAAKRIWKAVGLPASIYQGRPTHCIRKTFKTEVELLAKDEVGDLTPMLMEYQLGHSLGLRGVYTDMARTYQRELCLIANLCPDLRVFAKGGCASGVPRVRHLDLRDRKTGVI